MKSTQTLRRIALASLLALALPAAMAQSWPTKPVKVVVNFPPGGAADQIARAIGTPLSEALGQPVVVENRAGANGNLGGEVVAKSPADGYTLLFTYAGSQAVNPSLYPKIPFDSVEDFATITPVATTAFFLVVGANSPVKNFRLWVVFDHSTFSLETMTSHWIAGETMANFVVATSVVTSTNV